MIKKEIIQKIVRNFPNAKLNEPMKKHTSFGVGGVATVFVEVKERKELDLLIQLIRESDIPYFVIGGGTNLLVSDEGIEGVVIHLGKCFREIKVEGEVIRAGGGAKIGGVLNEALDKYLGGLEFMAGIPGTIGGAIKSGASAFGSSILPFLRKVEYLPNTGIILEAQLKLYPDNKQHIQSKIENFLRIKKRTQPLSLRSAGCVFKNPKGKFAGELIDKAGLKGKRVGGAYVSYKHANFIINRGDATSKDILTLMDLIKERIKEIFGIELEPEIHIVGEKIGDQEAN
jgi:UDP-N-acetylmuramate dehydrogenase